MRRLRKFWLIYNIALYSHGTIISIVGMGLVAFASLYIWLSGGALWRYPVAIRQVVAVMGFNGREGARMDCHVDIHRSFESYPPQCLVGTTLVWGDSHASRLEAGITNAHGPLAQILRDGCAPVPNFDLPYPQCNDSNAKMLDWIERHPPKRIIMFAAWLNNWKDFRLPLGEIEALDRALQRLTRVVPEIVIIGPAPFWKPNLPEQAYLFWRLTKEVPDRVDPLPLDYRAADIALAKVAKANGARYVSLYDLLCNEDGCLTHTATSRSDLIVFDYGHLTNAGARYVADLIGLN